MPLVPPPETFQWPSKRGPLSRIIKAPQCWQDEGILVPHEMFRWYFVEVREIMKAIEVGEIWKMKLFTKWVDVYVLDMIHHHHEAEEKIYNPWIEAGGGVLDKSQCDIPGAHDVLLKGVDELKQLLSRLLVNSTDEFPQQSVDAWNEFKTRMEEWMTFCETHFEEEEQMYPEQLKKVGFTKEQEQECVGKIIQGLGLDGNKLMLPAICYAMCMWDGEEKMQAFFDNGPPPPIKMLCQKCWINDFYVNNLCVINALKGTEEYEPETPACNVCVVS